MSWTRDRCWICLTSTHEMFWPMSNPHWSARTPHCSTRMPHCATTTRISAPPRYGGRPCTRKRSADIPTWRTPRSRASFLVSTCVSRCRRRAQHTRRAPGQRRGLFNSSTPRASRSPHGESKTRPNRARVFHNPGEPGGPAVTQRRRVPRHTRVRRLNRTRQLRSAVDAASGSKIELMETFRP
jgi:hypothetical protein